LISFLPPEANIFFFISSMHHILSEWAFILSIFKSKVEFLISKIFIEQSDEQEHNLLSDKIITAFTESLNLLNKAISL
jgi:hypothetical protein